MRWLTESDMHRKRSPGGSGDVSQEMLGLLVMLLQSELDVEAGRIVSNDQAFMRAEAVLEEMDEQERLAQRPRGL